MKKILASNFKPEFCPNFCRIPTLIFSMVFFFFPIQRQKIYIKFDTEFDTEFDTKFDINQ